MLYGILGIVVGGLAILFAKFVMPKMQAKIDEQARLQKEKKEAKKADKKEQ